MKHLSQQNLERLIADIQGDMSGFSTSAVCTFEEVYRNLETLDERIQGLTYDQPTETVTIPKSIGTYSDETITII